MKAMMRSKWIFIVFFTLWVSPLFSQIKFEASVSKTKLGVNERLRVDFEMNEDGDNFQPPSFQGFRVVAGPNQSISNSWINGKRTYSKTFTYFLSPTATGKFTIGQATIHIKGETYKTIPIEVEVTAAVDRPTDGDNNEIVSSGEIHLVAEVSKTNPYLNEAITVVYKLYVSPDTSVGGWRVISNPTFADFWSQSVDNQQLQVREGTYNGKPYRYAILRSTVLYPQKTGEVVIEPLTLDVQVEARTNRRDFWGRPIMTRINQTISSGSRKINVKNLPENGKPNSFNGAVGDFTMKVISNKDQLDAQESLEVNVEISGNGNLKLFRPPKFNFPQAFEVYDPEFKDRTTTTEKGMRGSISESYTLIPQFQGNYTIDPVEFSYFDPISETYKILRSEPLQIAVDRGPLAQTSSSGSTTPLKQPVEMSQQQFKFIKLRPELQPQESGHFFMSPLFWTLLVSPILAIPLFMFFIKKQRRSAADVEGQRLKVAGKLAKKYLSEAKKNMDNDKHFYESLERALHNYLKAKLHLETTDFSKDNIKEILLEKQVTEHQANEFINLLQSCEFARYTPASQGAIETDYQKAIQILSNIDKQIA